MSHAPLDSKTIKTLTAQGCSASDWSAVQATAGFDPLRVRNVTFIDRIALGANGGDVDVDGLRFPSGIYNATIANCDIGDNVLIRNVGTVLSNLRIEEDAAIVHVASIASTPNAPCGNGVQVAAINEGGGREVTLFNRLDAQIACMLATYRHNPAFIERLQSLIEKEVRESLKERALIGAGAHVLNCGPIKNVNIGAHARIDGAARLTDGTVLSAESAATRIGAGVCADHFIIAEGAEVDSGAILDRVFVGQGARLAKQFSAENSLFFANSEALNGESCALFAGPFTMTHHKSTLMVANLCSFFNAGSGTNQSNHMYKLGPVHQGVFERGCKTGSSAYLREEFHIGAYSVVIGQHTANLETQDLPFSSIVGDGKKSTLLPARALASVGLIRDSAKWPDRERRAPGHKRDLIIHNVISPYTVEKMRKGRDLLLALIDAPASKDDFVAFDEVRIKRQHLSLGARIYESAIQRYVAESVLDRAEIGLTTGKTLSETQDFLRPSGDLDRPLEWADVCGLLAPSEMIEDIETDVACGAIDSIPLLVKRLRAVHREYENYEWDYVATVYEQEFQEPLDSLTPAQFQDLLDIWETQSVKILEACLEDAEKEFAPSARIGYGASSTANARNEDFENVRGAMDTDETVAAIKTQINNVRKRAQNVKKRAASLA